MKKESSNRHDVFFNPNKTVCSWVLNRNHCRVQTSDFKITERIRAWSFARQVGECLVSSLRIFQIPKRKWKWVLKQLNIEGPPKNTKRIIQGAKLGRQSLTKDAAGNNQKKIKPIRSNNSKELAERVVR